MAACCLEVLKKEKKKTLVGSGKKGTVNKTNLKDRKILNREALRERLRTHKVFKKDQWFYINYHKFSIKSYVLDLY